MNHKQGIDSFGYTVHSINTTSIRHSDPGRSSAASRAGEGKPGREPGGSWAGQVKAVEADKGRLMGLVKAVRRGDGG